MSTAEKSRVLQRDGRGVSFAARLPRSPSAGATARRMVRTSLGHVVAPSTLDDVLLVVSELVMNAVRHGRGQVELQIGCDDGYVTGHVSDEGDAFAVPAEERPAAAAGSRGLWIVEQLAEDWGIQDQSAYVWFAIAGEPVGPASS
ncbi:MAG TPA: ATP-binding protein [Solirubrobacteraceae bacterium]|nr:ATP-binding protein [Solirubrobacteraceae bacterium]